MVGTLIALARDSEFGLEQLSLLYISPYYKPLFAAEILTLRSSKPVPSFISDRPENKARAHGDVTTAIK